MFRAGRFAWTAFAAFDARPTLASASRRTRLRPRPARRRRARRGAVPNRAAPSCGARPPRRRRIGGARDGTGRPPRSEAPSLRGGRCLPARAWWLPPRRSRGGTTRARCGTWRRPTRPRDVARRRGFPKVLPRRARLSATRARDQRAKRTTKRTMTTTTRTRIVLVLVRSLLRLVFRLTRRPRGRRGRRTPNSDGSPNRALLRTRALKRRRPFAATRLFLFRETLRRVVRGRPTTKTRRSRRRRAAAAARRG